MMQMTKQKERIMLQEIAEYLPFDTRLTRAQATALVSGKPTGEWAKTVFDYFFCHVDDDGNLISLQNFLKTHQGESERYVQADKIFIDHLFSVQKPLFFFDVDNTLTNFGHLSQEKIDFISNYSQKQRIILTTGKTYDSISNVISDCELQNNYASCLNGSVVIKDGVQTTIAQVGSISEEIVARFKGAPFTCVVYYNDNIRLVDGLTEDNIKMLKKYNELYFVEPTIDYAKVVKILFFIYEGETEKEQMVQDYVKSYPDLVCLRTAGHTYEILRKNQHKGNTVKAISHLLGNHYRATIGVGDSMNDSQLLSHVGKPFVVATASDELKQFGYEQLEYNRDVDIVNLIKQYT